MKTKVKHYKIIATLQQGMADPKKVGVFYRLDGKLYYREIERIKEKE